MATPEEQEAFKRAHWAHALAVSNQTGIDPRVAMAQAALESGWGTAAPGNNFHGMTGPGQVLLTNEVIDGKPVQVNRSFRMYANPAESWSDYGNNGVVKTAGKAQGIDAQSAALAPYASDPDYSKKIAATANDSSMVVPTDVQPSVLPPVPDATATPAAATSPSDGLLAARTAGDADLGGYSNPNQAQPEGITAGGADPNAANETAAGLGAAKIGTGLMAASATKPTQWAHVDPGANAPQAKAEGNPNFVQALAQMRLRRQQGGV